MAKNIVLLSDGTGNSSAKLFKTNVWRLFQLLDLRDPAKQVACYDNGVGTGSFRPLAILAEVFGFGLKRNVIDLYVFCCRNFEPGDRIYCFGFSRGAFTIRIVAGLIASQGLIAYNGNENDLVRYAADAYRDYRRRFNITRGLVTPARFVRDCVIRAWRWINRNPIADPNPKVPVDAVHFVGILDTVDAYGGPIEEVTRAIDYWIWPLSMPDRFMSARVHKACHALAIEDERDAFRPVIWDQRYVRGEDKSRTGTRAHRLKKTEWLFDVNYQAPSLSGLPLETPPHQRLDLAPIDRERISQVWFTGVHADIGGGYPQDGLSFVTLDWMMDRATAYGLLLHNQQRQLLITPQINPYDLLNDSRAGLAAYYRYKPRNLLELYSAPPYKPSIRYDWRHVWNLVRRKPDPQLEIKADLHPSLNGHVLPPPLPAIHQSVFDRIASGNDRYAPVVLPEHYYVTDKAGNVSHARPAIDHVPQRPDIQDNAWNWIWLRRVVYFLTVFASLFVASIPFAVIYKPGFGEQSVGPFVLPFVNMAASFLPNFLTPWFDAFRDAPGFVLVGAAAVVLLMLAGSYLQARIRDVMRAGWSAATGAVPARNWWQRFVYWLRRRGTYRAFFYILKNWIFPTGIVFWLALWLAFGVANTLGLICKGKGGTEVTTWDLTSYEPFRTSNVCNATGLKVTHGERYRIELEIREPWLDGSIATDPNGFGWSTMSWRQIWGVPYRRLIWSNWFATILRVGGPGLEEHRLVFTEEEVKTRLPTTEQERQMAQTQAPTKKVWAATFRARSDGEVFLYVNDTVIGLPWIFDFFYTHNNKGSAVVTLRKEKT